MSIKKAQFQTSLSELHCIQPVPRNTFSTISHCNLTAGKEGHRTRSHKPRGEIIHGGGEWRAEDSRGSVEVKTPLVLDVEHQISPIQELHNEEQMILLQIIREWNNYWCYPTINQEAMCLQGTNPFLVKDFYFMHHYEAPTELSGLVL